jgi:hypothetical protein
VRLPHETPLTLTARMRAGRTAPGYRLWTDVTADFIYLAENLAGAEVTDSTFRGIRIPRGPDGKPSGETQEAIDIVWADKSGTWT